MSQRPGEVWLADLGLAAKTRPVVIVSRYDPDAPRALTCSDAPQLASDTLDWIASKLLFQPDRIDHCPTTAWTDRSMNHWK